MTTLTEQRSPRAVPTSAAAVTRKPFPLVRHSLSLAKRSLIKTWRTPEALIDVTLQPAIFLVIFVYIFGGAVAGDTHTYLQFLLPGILAQTIATGAIAIGVNLNTDLQKGIFDRFRSLPVPRSAPLIDAWRRSLSAPSSRDRSLSSKWRTEAVERKKPSVGIPVSSAMTWSARFGSVIDWPS